MDDLGNGLRMADFEQLLAEITNLSDKIEDRNNELNKCRLRCEAETQQLAHIREKSHLLNDDVTFKMSQWEQVKQIQSKVRLTLGGLKSKRLKYRRQHDELVRSCGLLIKTDLLFHFDDTQTHIQELETKTLNLKNTNKDLEEKIKILTEESGDGKKIDSKIESGEELNNIWKAFNGMNEPCYPDTQRDVVPRPELIKNVNQ